MKPIINHEAFFIKSNQMIAKDVYQLELVGDASSITKPGQFVNVQVEDHYLRRPLSVCNVEKDLLRLIYKVFGSGTKKLSEAKEDSELSIILPLGNGFDTTKSKKRVLLIGGGVGVPPLYLLAKKLLEEKKEVKVILGFNQKDEIFYEKEFKKLGCEVRVTTVDGSYGSKGFVTDILEDIDYDYFYSCGPMPMLKAVYQSTKTSGEFSLEERMGCGFGACMGCTCKTKDSYKRICKEGPVFVKEELKW